MVSLCTRCDKRFPNTTISHYRRRVCPECQKKRGGKAFTGKIGYMERLMRGDIKITRLENEYGKGGTKWEKNICIELVQE